MNSLFVSKVQDHEGLNTNLDNLYNSIKQLLEGQKDVKIVLEYKGLLNAITLRSIVALISRLRCGLGLYVKFMSQ
ncbi:MAG: hypothetical protein ACJ71K_08150 [Nitrososphaeraceae archaeon]|jgi:hypothetical protein